MKTGKKTASILLIPLFFCLLLFSGGYLYLKQTAQTASFSSFLTEERTMRLQNPYRGFYRLYGLTLTDNDASEAEELAARIAADEDHALALLEINLKNFKDEPLSGPALTQLDRLLSLCCETNHQFIVRFLYDWDGKALETEPDSIELIETHMEQVAHYVNLYKDHIYLLQGIFLGDCGEMHHSKHMDADSMTRLLKKLAAVTDESVYLSVRTPAHWRIINNRTSAPSDRDMTSSAASRLGLFNDGMLGSDTDLGTYGTSSFAGSSNPADKGTREEELDFQSRLCRFVPNGGECVLDNPFNDLENAAADFEKMNVSYLNSQHDEAVINKWKSSVFKSTDPETEIFDGMNGFDYIEARLGYRYVLEDASLDYTPRLFSSTATLIFSLKNSGFSPAYKQFSSTLVMKNSETGETTEIKANFDNRSVNSGETAVITLPIDLNAMEEGTYRIYFQMKDEATGLVLKFANEAPDGQETPDDGGVLLGSITIS